MKKWRVVMGKGGSITLTESGLEKAKNICERHIVLTDFLERTAHIDKEIAKSDACRMEHYLSDEAFQGIKRFMDDNGNVCSSYLDTI